MMFAVLICILMIAGLIVLSGLLSLAEMALISARKSPLRERSSRGDRGAAAALRLSDQIDQVVPAVRLGLALTTTLAGLSAGVWLAWSIDVGPGRWGAFVMLCSLAIAAITVTTLLVADLLPRRLALNDPERLASLLARPVGIVATAISPVVRALEWVTGQLARILGVRSVARPRITHDELLELLGEATDGGTFGPAEAEIFKRVFRFCDRRARTIMTPRSEVVWIDLADSPEEIRNKVVGTTHSRFPVCDQSLDNLLGIVQVKDLLAQRSDGPMFRVKGFLTLPAFIFEGTRGPQVLEILKKSSTHIAVVLDEYGSVVGLLTLNDILENVLGNMPEGRGGSEESPIVLRPDGSRLIEGRLPIDEFRELYHLDVLPEGDFHTLAGLVVTQLGHIPRISETLVFRGLRFEVVEMNANRVVRLLVSSENGEQRTE
jgi:putative hemolysin